MAESSTGQKTEAPTAKRLADSAQEGDVLQSRDLSTLLVMGIGLGWLIFAGSDFVDACAALLRSALTIEPDRIDNFDPLDTLTRILTFHVLPLLALMLSCVIAACLTPVLLGASGFRSKAFAVKFARLNPISGLARLFGRQGVTELAKALLKLVSLCGVAWFAMRDDLLTAVTASPNGIEPAAAAAGHLLIRVVFCLTAGLCVIAAIDVPVQYFQRIARLRMSLQEVKDELRQSEGMPELKQQLRRRQLEMASFSGRRAVAEATVILANPDHFAVALRYVPGKDHAPMVIARGRGEAAAAIKALASKERIPTLHYPQLTRAIYFTSRAGQTIAEDLYIAVAVILAFVFNLEQAMRENIAQPVVDVPPGKRFDAEGRLQQN